jgi:DtxR family transcriptional regulator, Mn-dependent transcriptional regulator
LIYPQISLYRLTKKVSIYKENIFVNAMAKSKITPAVEDYLRTIYALEEEVQPVIAARIADEVGVSAPTMVSTLRRLEREGYIKVERRKEIRLTTEGRQVAERILRRHFLIERFLTDLLGLDWVKAHQEAHRLEHAVSQEVEERLAKLLNYPTTCPHGNPIPGRQSSKAKKGIPLHQVPEGKQVELEYITEGGERDARLLGFLQDHKLVPGTKVHVLDVAPSLGTMSLKVGHDEFSLGIEAAKKIRVH